MWRTWESTLIDTCCLTSTSMKLIKKVMGILIYTSRISDKLDRHNRIIIIQTLVLSLKILGTTTDKLMSDVQKLQNFAARVAFGGVRMYDYISPVFRELEWLRTKQKCLFDVDVTAFKVLRGFYSDWFLSFKCRRAITNGKTRQSQQLCVPRTNTHTGDKRYPHCGTLSHPPSHRHLHYTILRQNLRNFF